MQALRVSTVKDGPPRSTSTRDTLKRSSPATASSHSRSARLRARVGLGLLVRRDGDGDQQDPVEPELLVGLLRHDQVAEVRRVERPAEEPEPRGYPRTWPSPRTTYFVVHSSRMPIGPRACSFWVELPISAPMPNSPPSVKRVEALT